MSAPFGSKNRKYQYFVVCCPETGSCASKPLLLPCKLAIPKCMCQVLLGLKEVQMWAHDLKLNKVPLFALKSVNIIVSMSAAPETASCVSKPLLLLYKLVIPQCLCQVSLGLKEVQMGPMTSNLTRCFFCSKISAYQCFDVCCPKTCPCVSKPLLLRCKLVIPHCLCQVSLGLKEVLNGVHDFKLNKVPFLLKISEYQCFEVSCPKTS